MKCSTCVKALKYLNQNNLYPEVIDIKNFPPTKEELKRYHELSNVDINKFFNTSGLVYKELNLKEKIKEMTLDEKYELLSSNGMLIKRPLLITENIVKIGFKEKEYDELWQS